VHPHFFSKEILYNITQMHLNRCSLKPRRCFYWPRPQASIRRTSVRVLFSSDIYETRDSNKAEIKTSSSAIAERPRCTVGQLRPKYQYRFPYSKNMAVDCCCSYAC